MSLNATAYLRLAAPDLKADAGRSVCVLAGAVIVALRKALEAREADMGVRTWQLDALLCRMADCKKVFLLVLQAVAAALSCFGRPRGGSLVTSRVFDLNAIPCIARVVLL